MIDVLNNTFFSFFLGQISDVTHTTPFQQAWLQEEDMGFVGEERVHLERYLRVLHDYDIRLTNSKDVFIWSKNPEGDFYTWHALQDYKRKRGSF